jgi:hypothetical protein
MSATIDTAEREWITSAWVATMLTPKIEIAEALLRNEAVPLSQLDPVWVKRLAAEPPIRKPRVTLADFYSIPLEYDPFPTNGARP